MSDKRTSLQKLQALDKDFKDLPNQLKELCVVLRAPELLRQDATTIRTKSRSANGRLDWALRWLLSKLKAAGDSGEEARASSPAWILLANLINSLHPTPASRALNNAGVLSIIGDVLRENFATHFQSTPASVLQASEAKEDGKDVSMMDADSSETGKKSKKRKRESQDENGKEHKRMATEAHTSLLSTHDQTRKRRELYQALRMVLDVLVTPSQSELQKEDRVDLEPFKATLIMDTVNAAAFLGRWLDASEDNISFSAALQIWRSRIATPGEDVLIIFSRHCLAPATVMLQQLKGQRDSLKGGSRKTPIEPQIAILEKLIAEHVLLPAKRRYRQQRNSSGEGSDSDESILVNVLAPLHGNDQVIDAIADLFELAIRCTPMSTPRRRVAESPWLEDVFNALADCIGCGPHTKAVEKPEGESVFVELVQLASKHNVNLQRRTTKAILQNYVLRNEYNTEWSLLAQLVKIDSGLFVDDLDTLKEVFVATHYDSPLTSDYDDFRDEVFIPILKALVAARSLRTFIKLWHDELKDSFKRWSPRNEDRSLSSTSEIWEDANLVRALSQHIEISMTTRQLTELIGGMIHDLTTDKEPHLTAAHASMLSSIFNALQNVDIVKVLLPTMRELLDLALARLQSIDSVEYEAKSRLWALIATLHRLYTSAAAPVDAAKLVMTYDSQLDTVVNASLQQGQGTSPEPANFKVSSSLACLGSICGDIQSRHIALTSFNSVRSLPAFLRSVKSGLPVSVLIDLADVLSCFPVLLLQEEHSNNRAVIVSSMFSTWLRAMKSAGHLEEGYMTEEHLSTTHIVKWNGVLDDADNISDSDSAPVPNQESLQPGPLARLSRMPLDQCNQEKREVYIDMIGSMMQSVTDSVESWSVALSALLRFLKNRTMTSPSDTPVDLAKIALRLDKYIHESSSSAADSSALSLLFYEICCLVLSSRLKVDGDKGDSIQKETDDSTKHFIHHENSHIATLALLKAMVSAKSTDGATFSIDQAFLIMTLCRELREMTGQSHIKVTSDPDPRKVAAILDVLASLSNQEVFSKQKDMIENLLEDQKLSSIDDISVKEMRYRLECRLKRAESAVPDIEKTLALLAVVKSRQNARVVESAVLETLTVAAPDARFEFVKALMPSSEKSFFGQERLQLLHVLVKASSSKQYRAVLPEELVAPLASSLQLALPKSTTLAVFTPTAQSLQHLLESHSRHLPQSVIENTLLTISSICSPSSSANIPPTPQTSRHIFTLTTNLLQTLLTHHRRKLRGRFELVILALQALLRCLFTSSGTSTFGRIQQPPWLPRKSSSVDGKGLDATHVAQYTRLLTSICDPTLSAVRSGASKGGAGLTDETRKAKRYAGQYVQYVLMELCECQLKGRLVGGADGAREALTLGVWAMLEVIGKDGLSACMEGMAGGGRSVLRGWWEEWRTVGRGRW